MGMGMVSEFRTRGCTATHHRGVAGFRGVVSSLPAKVKVSNSYNLYYYNYIDQFSIYKYRCSTTTTTISTSLFRGNTPTQRDLCDESATLPPWSSCHHQTSEISATPHRGNGYRSNSHGCGRNYMVILLCELYRILVNNIYCARTSKNNIYFVFCGPKMTRAAHRDWAYGIWLGTAAVTVPWQFSKYFAVAVNGLSQGRTCHTVRPYTAIYGVYGRHSSLLLIRRYPSLLNHCCLQVPSFFLSSLPLSSIFLDLAQTYRGYFLSGIDLIKVFRLT